MQDRLGFHSFRRGDIVRFTNALEGESAEAWVHSFMYKPAANGAQATGAEMFGAVRTRFECIFRAEHSLLVAGVQGRRGRI